MGMVGGFVFGGETLIRGWVFFSLGKGWYRVLGRVALG